MKCANLVNAAIILAKGTWVNFDHLFMMDGLWWNRFKYAAKGSSTFYFFAPVGEKLTGVGFSTANKNKSLWGTVTKLNSSEDKSGVKDWHKKDAVV